MARLKGTGIMGGQSIAALSVMGYPFSRDQWMSLFEDEEQAARTWDDLHARGERLFEKTWAAMQSDLAWVRGWVPLEEVLPEW